LNFVTALRIKLKDKKLREILQWATTSENVNDHSEQIKRKKIHEMRETGNYTPNQRLYYNYSMGSWCN